MSHRWPIPKPPRAPATVQRLFVGNLDFAVTERELRDLFEEVGRVVSAQIIQNPESGRSRGCGFVTFASPVAMNAVERLNGREVRGRAIRVAPARSA